MITVARPSGRPYLLAAATQFYSDGFYDAGTLSVFDPSTGSTINAPIDQDPLTLTAGDLFGDGRVVVAVLEATQVQLLISEGDGGFSDAGALALPASDFGEGPCNDQAQVVFGDVNGDGLLDLVAFCADDPGLAVSMAPDFASFAAVSTTNVCGGPNSIAIGGPVGSESIVFNCPTNQSIQNSTNSDEQVFDAQIPLHSPSVYKSGLANTGAAAATYLQDLNNDGILDLLSLDSDVTGGGIAVLYGSSGGGYIEGPTFAQPYHLNYTGAAFGDLNGDGINDVAIYATSDAPVPYGDGGAGGSGDTFLQAIVVMPDAGLSNPVLVDITPFGVAYPENTPGPAIAVGDFLGLGSAQIAVLDVAGDVRVFQAVCQ